MMLDAILHLLNPLAELSHIGLWYWFSRGTNFWQSFFVPSDAIPSQGPKRQSTQSLHVASCRFQSNVLCHLWHRWFWYVLMVSDGLQEPFLLLVPADLQPGQTHFDPRFGCLLSRTFSHRTFWSFCSEDFLWFLCMSRIASYCFVLFGVSCCAAESPSRLFAAKAGSHNQVCNSSCGWAPRHEPEANDARCECKYVQIHLHHMVCQFWIVVWTNLICSDMRPCGIFLAAAGTQFFQVPDAEAVREAVEAHKRRVEFFERCQWTS